MPDVVLFGATGYTGRLTADALARRGADFALAGRNQQKLEALSNRLGAPEIRSAQVGDVDGLARCLDDARVLVTSVGPFARLGDTAVEAALKAGVHYVDSTGEGAFIAAMIEKHDHEARARGIALAPALGFDEVPADVATTLAVEDLESADVTLTYALPTAASMGTRRTALGIIVSEGRWIKDGRPVTVRARERHRWAPMPPPLGVRASHSFPLSSGYVVPLHLSLRNFSTFVTTGKTARFASKVLLPLLRAAFVVPGARDVIEKAFAAGPEGPDEDARARSRWTVLAEARAGDKWRNVALAGTDPYGLTAETLAAGAMRMAESGFSGTGVIAPVEALGLDRAEKTLIDNGVTIDVYGAGSANTGEE
jgi:short subunit dehydrogenase-like uncharacterized protein